MHATVLDSKTAVQELGAALELARKLGSNWWLGNATTYLARTRLLENDLAGAEAVLSAAWPIDHQPATLAERRVRWAWGELALARGDADAALEIALDLQATAPGGPRPQQIPALRNLEAQSLAMLGRNDEAVLAFERALEGTAARGSLPMKWQIHRGFGRLLQVMRRTDDALRQFADARDSVEIIASRIDDQPLREHFSTAALATLPRPRGMTAARAAKEAFGGLTAREREVAAHIAYGRSNREIADLLVLGERTIETHVGNVLSKLQFTSRAQIAAWAVENGLRESVAPKV